MPVFVCFSGAADYLALTEAGCFAVEDIHGRQWLCFESQARSIPDDAVGDGMQLLTSAQQQALRAGLKPGPAHWALVLATSPGALPEHLGSLNGPQSAPGDCPLADASQPLPVIRALVREVHVSRHDRGAHVTLDVLPLGSVGLPCTLAQADRIEKAVAGGERLEYDHDTSILYLVLPLTSPGRGEVSGTPH